MMRPKKLSGWDFSDTIDVREGYDYTSVPDITRDNFNTLLDEYNNLVAVVNTLINAISPTGVVFEDEDDR